MHPLSFVTRGWFARSVGAALLAASVVGCGGGSPSVEPLSLALTRVGPYAVAIDWSDDPYVAVFDVYRDGYRIASVSTSTSLIDNAVNLNQTYCYQVSGYDVNDELIAATDTGCIRVAP